MNQGGPLAPDRDEMRKLLKEKGVKSLDDFNAFGEMLRDSEGAQEPDRARGFPPSV